MIGSMTRARAMSGASYGWRSFLLVTACVAVAGCGRSSQPEPVSVQEPPAPFIASTPTGVDADELKQLLQQCDVGKVMPILRDVLGSPASADLLMFLSDSWADGGGDPAVNHCMQKEIVRVSVANALAQAQANRMLEVPQLESVLDTLRGSLTSPSSEIAHTAIMGIGDFLTERDIAKLRQIALDDKCCHNKSAYAALALSCNPKASEELDRLATIDQKRADLVREFRGLMQEARTLKCDSE
ncbi:hypothetical protein GCM10011487_30330 [Steroidobacter agaridevorans]|uniref:Lipoprotein n=1 Tax=Steroidobacter agaridevorans TaxID=2695856 RepID=A0A829YDK4_9GAMM|nr:hypothetical protein [Steroidobacter agaridevorans]GFE81033.1 hypothetical protein GCM10011487_30330 [Steroidobacter agaridevorans]